MVIGAEWTLDRNNDVSLDSDDEFAAQNRSESQRYTLPWVSHFD